MRRFAALFGFGALLLFGGFVAQQSIGFDNATGSLCVWDRSASPQCVPTGIVDGISHVYVARTGVATRTDLAALGAGSSWAGFTVRRHGYAAAGDGGAVDYTYSATACSIAGGDGGSQVAPAAGGGCWVAALGGRVDARVWGVSTAAADNAVAIDAAVAAVAAHGGGEVALPPGTLWTSNVALSSGVVLRGAGRDATVLKLLAGKNTDVVTSAGFYALAGTNSAGGLAGGGLADLTIDGNASAQTGPAASYAAINCVALYGYGLRISDVVLRNCYGNGLRTEWGSGAEPVGGMESLFDRITVDTAGGNGWDMQGPHDAGAREIVVIDASQLADDTYDGIRVTGHGGGRFFNIHPWHRNAATNRMRYSFYGGTTGGNQITASHFEGGRHWAYLGGNANSISNSEFYALFNVAGEAGITLAGAQSTVTGSTIKGPYSSGYAIALGTAGTASFQNVIGGSTVVGFREGIANVVNSTGYNVVDVAGYDNKQSCPQYTGTLAATDAFVVSNDACPTNSFARFSWTVGTTSPYATGAGLSVAARTGTDAVGWGASGYTGAGLLSVGNNGSADFLGMRLSARSNPDLVIDGSGNAGFGVGWSSSLADKVTVSGTLNATSFKAGGTAGVSCPGPPTASFAVVKGIVTHC